MKFCSIMLILLCLSFIICTATSSGTGKRHRIIVYFKDLESATKALHSGAIVSIRNQAIEMQVHKSSVDPLITLWEFYSMSDVAEEIINMLTQMKNVEYVEREGHFYTCIER